MVAGTKAIWIWGVTALALLAVAGFLYMAVVYVRSETVIQRRYPLPSTLPHAKLAPGTVARGAHLVRILGCTDCHGPELRGRMIAQDDDFQIYASNLRALPDGFADRDIARAIRFGLRPNGTSIWMMPSSSYVFMRKVDVGAIIAYLRSRPPEGFPTVAPRFDMAARRRIARGEAAPAAFDIQDLPNSLDLGPRYEGGRYLARAACAECHGLDLAGSRDRRAPDLAVVGRYSVSDFLALLFRGHAPGGRAAPTMARVADRRFRYLADYEVLALYRYLYLRSIALPVTRTPS